MQLLHGTSNNVKQQSMVIEYIKGCAAGSQAHIQETGLDLTRINVKYTNTKRISIFEAFTCHVN